MLIFSCVSMAADSSSLMQPDRMSARMSRRMVRIFAGVMQVFWEVGYQYLLIVHLLLDWSKNIITDNMS